MKIITERFIEIGSGILILFLLINVYSQRSHRIFSERAVSNVISNQEVIVSNQSVIISNQSILINTHIKSKLVKP